MYEKMQTINRKMNANLCQLFVFLCVCFNWKNLYKKKRRLFLRVEFHEKMLRRARERYKNASRFAFNWIDWKSMPGDSECICWADSYVYALNDRMIYFATFYTVNRDEYEIKKRVTVDHIKDKISSLKMTFGHKLRCFKLSQDAHKRQGR